MDCIFFETCWRSGSSLKNRPSLSVFLPRRLPCTMPNYIMFFSFFVSYVTQSKQSKHEQYCFVVMPLFCWAVDQYAWCARCFRVSGFTQYHFEDLVILNRLVICFGGSWSVWRIDRTGRAVERPVAFASAIMWIKWQLSFSELEEERVDYFTDKLYLFLSFSRLIYMADYGSFVSATTWLCFFFLLLVSFRIV